MKKETGGKGKSLRSRAGAGRVLAPEFLAQQFKPGQSGNPTGSRGADYREILCIARANSTRAINRLIDLIESDDERIALLASQIVLDRAFGKPGDMPASEAPHRAPEHQAALQAMISRLDRLADEGRFEDSAVIRSEAAD